MSTAPRKAKAPAKLSNSSWSLLKALSRQPLIANHRIKRFVSAVDRGYLLDVRYHPTALPRLQILGYVDRRDSPEPEDHPNRQPTIWIITPAGLQALADQAAAKAKLSKRRPLSPEHLEWVTSLCDWAAGDPSLTQWEQGFFAGLGEGRHQWYDKERRCLVTVGKSVAERFGMSNKEWRIADEIADRRGFPDNRPVKIVTDPEAFDDPMRPEPNPDIPVDADPDPSLLDDDLPAEYKTMVEVLGLNAQGDYDRAAETVFDDEPAAGEADDS